MPSRPRAAASGGWAKKTAYNRGQVLYRFAEALESRSDGSDEYGEAIDLLVHYAGWTDKLAAVMGGVNPVAAPFLSLLLAGADRRRGRAGAGLAGRPGPGARDRARPGRRQHGGRDRLAVVAAARAGPRRGRGRLGHPGRRAQSALGAPGRAAHAAVRASRRQRDHRRHVRRRRSRRRSTRSPPRRSSASPARPRTRTRSPASSRWSSSRPPGTRSEVKRGQAPLGSRQAG